MRAPNQPSVTCAIPGDVADRRSDEEAVVRLDAIVESSNDGIVTIAPNGSVLSWNPGAERLYGWTAAEAVGRSVFELIFTPSELGEVQKDTISRAFAGTAVPAYDSIRTGRDGRRLDVSVTAFPICDANGAVVAVGGIHRDISERKRAEEAVARLAAIVESSTDGIITLAPDGSVIGWNAGAERLYGWPATEAIGRPVFELISTPADLADAQKDVIAGAFAGKLVEGHDTVRFGRDGGRVDVSFTTFPILKENGVVVAAASIHRDITERKRRDEEVNLFFELVPDLACIASSDGFLKKVSGAWEATLGFSKAELLATPFSELIHPDDRDATLAEVEKQLTGRSTADFVNRFLRKDGSYRWLEWRAAPADGALFFGVARDITDRRQAEESIARLAAIVESSNDGILMIAPDRSVLSWNAGAEGIYGWTAAEAVGRPLIELISTPADLVEAQRDILMAAFAGEVVAGYDTVRFGRDGRRVDVSLTVFPIRSETGAVVAVGGIHRDISERRHAEAELQQSRALLQAIMDGTTDAIFVKDLDGRYVMANAATCRAVGKSQEEILGRDDYFFFAADEAKAVMDADRRTLELVSTRTYEEKVTTADGQLRTYLATKGPVFDASGSVIAMFGASRDITDRKHMEAALLRSEKLESLGEFAGGLAHDFNNVLTVILGNSALAAIGMPEGSLGREALEEIQKATRRGAELAGLLLDASGRGVLARRPFDLSALTKETVALLTPSFGGLSMIEYELAPGLPWIHGDASQVQRVLLTLVVNATEALGDRGGHVVLATGVAHVGNTDADRRIREQGLIEGQYVYVDVTDDGPGMPPEIVRKVFDPFFTTKFAGRGLGLSAGQGIVRAHGGAITVTSVPGHGTTFRVMFPVASDFRA